MNKKIFIPSLSFLLILGSTLYSLDLKTANAASVIGEETLILYDAASGAIPGAPLLSFIDFPTGAASPTYTNGVTLIDTAAAGSETYAGWIANAESTPGFPILDRTDGFQLDVTLQVEEESHASNHRAGFSIIILSEDAKGVEVAFWENEIWVQSDDATGGLFRHGEGIAFATTGALTDYRITIMGDTYTLSTDIQTLLTGPLRDYSAFDGFPDPYETPNFLFLGDDTTSAQGRVRLSFISITGTEPVVPTAAVTSTNTDTPLPTTSPTPLLTVTPVPSSIPAQRAVEFCPSGWIFLVVTLGGTTLIKKFRAGH